LNNVSDQNKIAQVWNIMTERKYGFILVVRVGSKHHLLSAPSSISAASSFICALILGQKLLDVRLNAAVSS